MSNRKKITKITCLILAASMFTSQSVFSDNTAVVTTSSADNTKTVVSSSGSETEPEKTEKTAAVSESAANKTDESNTESSSASAKVSASEKSDAEAAEKETVKNETNEIKDDNKSSVKRNYIQNKELRIDNNSVELYEDTVCDNAIISYSLALKGHDLDINGDLTLNRSNSKLLLQGGNLTVKGNVYIDDGGSIDISGGTLTVLGNVCMSSQSNLIIGDGSAEISGDVIMGYKRTAEDGTKYYSTERSYSSSSFIKMEDKKGILKINGSLLDNSYVPSVYKAGTLELKGDYNVFYYYQCEPTVSEKDFKLILNGDKKQKISANNKSIIISNLEINNTSKEGAEVDGIIVENVVNNTNTPVTPGFLNADSIISLKKDSEWDQEKMSGHYIDLNGFTLTANDDLDLKDTCINVNKGSLIVKGSLDTSETGILIMHNEEDQVSVEKEFTVDLDVNRCSFESGTINCKGNVTFEKTRSDTFYSGSDFTMVFAGTEKQRVSLITDSEDKEFNSSVQIGNFRNDNEKGLSINKDLEFVVTNTLLNSKNENAFFTDGYIILDYATKVENNKFKGNIDIGSNLNSDFEVDGNVFGLRSLNGHSLKINGSLFLNSDLSFYSGNLYVKNDLVISKGKLNPGTGKVEIGNDLILKNYIQNSDGSISYSGTYSEGENTIVSSGSVNLEQTEGSITVGGSFISDSEAESIIKDGTFEVKGNIDIEDSGHKSFDSSGNGKVVLSGSKKQTVSVDNPGSVFGVMELKNTSSDGVEFLTDVQYSSIEKNTSVLKYSEKLKNSKLYESTETIDGDLVLDYGELDLKGKKLTVKGNIIQNGGTIKLSGGSIVCEKDYVLGNSAKLIMSSQDEVVDIAGKFTLSSGISHETLLTAGTILLSGDLEQTNEAAFKAGNKLELVFDGSSVQNIKTNAVSVFGGIRFENTSEKGIILESDICGSGSIYEPKCSYSGGAIVLTGNAELKGSKYNGSLSIKTPVKLENDLQISGDLTVMSDMNISANNVNVSGNINVTRDKGMGNIALTTGSLSSEKDLLIENGILNVGSGTVKVTGDMTNHGSIAMEYSDGRLSVGGAFNVLSSSALNRGIIEIGGNVSLEAGLSGSESTWILNGKTKQTFENTKEFIPFLHILEMNNTSEEGVEVLSYINSDQIIENETTVKYANDFSFGYTLSEDKELDELTITGGVLDLNGKTLHVKGDFKQYNGQLLFNGGKLIVDGNFDLLNRTQLIMEDAGSCLEIKGNANLPQSLSKDYDDDRLILKEGTIDFSGDLICGRMHAGENFNLKFSGTEAQNISGTVITTGNLMINNSSSEGITFNGRVDVTTKLYDTKSVINNNCIYLNKGAVLENNQFSGNIHIAELADDIVINGDLEITDKPDFNGHKIKVNGDVYIDTNITIDNAEQLEISGDIIVESGTLTINDKYNINNLLLSGGKIIAEADVNVKGDFIAAKRSQDENGNELIDEKGYNYNYNNMNLEINSSRFVVNGDFTANATFLYLTLNSSELEVCGDINICKALYNYSSSDMFTFDENSKLILGGSKKQYISVKSSRASFGVIELKNTSAEGVEFVTPVRFTKLISNNVPYTNLENNEIGFKLEEDTTIKSTNIKGGTLDLNGHSLTVEGDLELSGGTLCFNGGELHVTGNLNIAGVNGGSSYSSVLMKKNTDLLDVCGDLNINPFMKSFYNDLSSGTIKVGGDLYLEKSIENYGTTINAFLELDGKDKQVIRNDNEDIRLYHLKINNSSEDGVDFASQINVYNLYDTSSKIINGKNIKTSNFADYAFHGDVTVSDFSYSDFHDIIIFGDLYYSNNYNTITIKNRNLKVTGDVICTKGFSLEEGGGLIVGGSLKSTGEESLLKLCSEDSYVYVGGDISFKTLIQQAGILRSKGNVNIEKTEKSTQTGDQIIILDGENKQLIELPEEIRFDTAMLSKDTDTGYSFSVKESWENLVMLDHKIDSEVPASPTEFTSSEQKVSSIVLSWKSVLSDNDNDRIGYNIYRDGILIGKTYENKFADHDLVPNTSYTYSIEAFNIYRNVSEKKTEGKFATIADTEAPEKPSNIKTFKTDNKTVDISWDSSNDNDSIEKYIVYREGEMISECSKYTNSYIDEDTPLGKTVKYEISAVDRSGNESEKALVNVDNILPLAPVEINVSYDNGRIDLNWKSPDTTEMYNYKIVRSCEGEADKVLNEKSLYTNYSDSSFVLGQKYTYSIYSIDNAGNISEEPLKTEAVYSKDDYPPTISYISETGKINNTESFRININDNIGLKSYKIEISEAGNNKWSILKEGDITGKYNEVSFIPDVSGLKTGTYDIKITATDEAGNISPEKLIKREYTQTVLKTPELDVELSGNNVSLSWNDQGEENVSSVRVYRKSATETEQNIASYIQGTSYTDTNVKADEEYTYRICVVDKLGNAVYSDEKTIKVSADEEFKDCPYHYAEKGYGFEITKVDPTEKGSIVIPSEINGKPVHYIAANCFKNCLAESIVIPDSVQSIGDYAFENCINIKKFELPSYYNLQIGSGIFNGCSSLEEINIKGLSTTYSLSLPSSKVTVRFDLNSRTAHYINSSYKCIPNDCEYIMNDDKTVSIISYSGNSGQIYIPDTINGYPVSEISDGAFMDKTYLSTVNGGKNVKKIGSYAFYGCSKLSTVSLYNTELSQIGADAFTGTSSLIYRDGFAFAQSKNEKILIKYNGKSKNVTIPKDVTVIADDAFADCDYIKTVKLPYGLKSIGSGAFFGCEKLQKIVIPGKTQSIGDYAFSCCYELSAVSIPDTCVLGKDVFFECKKLPDSYRNTEKTVTTAVTTASEAKSTTAAATTTAKTTTAAATTTAKTTTAAATTTAKTTTAAATTTAKTTTAAATTTAKTTTAASTTTAKTTTAAATTTAKTTTAAATTTVKTTTAASTTAATTKTPAVTTAASSNSAK